MQIFRYKNKNLRNALQHSESFLKNTIEFSNKDWDNLLELLDTEKFYALSEVIGCPDCADGGAEWIEIVTEEKTQKMCAS